MSENKTGEQIFINGRGQIVEMLKLMPREERERILRGVAARNKQLAMELGQECLSFNDLERLGDEDLLFIIERIKAPILGIALKGANQEFQRRVLRLARREYAEEAYETMLGKVMNGSKDIQRAQSKIMSLLPSILSGKQTRS